MSWEGIETGYERPGCWEDTRGREEVGGRDLKREGEKGTKGEVGNCDKRE